MRNKDLASMGEIYEGRGFESSFDKNYDPWIAKQKAHIDSVCHAIEHKLEGTISYYNHYKDEFAKNPTHLDNSEALENMLKHLTEPLYPYQEFRFEEKPYKAPQGSKLFGEIPTKKTN